MSRTSLPVDSATKERRDELKRTDETWNEFSRRTVSDDEPIQQGDLSEEALAAIEDNIEKRRQSF